MRLAPRLNQSNHLRASHTTFDNQYGHKKNTKYRNTNQPFPSALFTPILFFLTNTPLASHLKYPLFQSLSRFTGIRFVRTKHNQFFFRGVLTTIMQSQSTRGCGHLSGPDSQCLRTGLFWPDQCWQDGKGDSRDTSTFVTSCPIGMSLPADYPVKEGSLSTSRNRGYQCQRQRALCMRRGPSTYWPTLGRGSWMGTPWGCVGLGLV